MNRMISLIAQNLLCDLACKVTLADGKSVSITPVLEDGGDICTWRGEGDGVSIALTARASDGSLLFTVDLVSAAPLLGRALTFPLSFDAMDHVMEIHHDTPWWMMCGWPKSAEEVQPKTQNFLMQKGTLHYSIVPLTGDIFRCEADADGLHLDAGCDGFTRFHGAFLTVSLSTNPISAVENNYRFAKAEGAIRVPLREEREYPALFEDFGWCSWNAFYQEPTSEKIYSKLDEFKEKNVPVRWIIIDDGWSTYKDNRLVDFPANPAKFPEGLKECIRRIKEDYGIPKVGVWHTFNGYWDGIDPASPLAEQYADALMTTKTGMLIPSDDPDKAFRFWDAWHGYLADCGVDFVKVDNQSSTHNYLSGTVSTTEGARHAHEAIERSVNKHFGGCIIDCMGMDMENVLARPTSAVARNSDDFFPDRENGFAKHIQQNLFCAIWHSQIHHCDYDMWWSGKSAPIQSGVLRAISGGPVYVSDKVGETALAGVIPVCGEDGDLCRLDHAAMPTLDCLYRNCETEGHLLKAYNHKGDSIALAVFNISKDTITETFSFDVIPGFPIDREYIAYEYFTGIFTRVHFSTEETLTLPAGDVRAYSLYPVIRDSYDEADPDGNAYILFGDEKRYISIGSRSTEKRGILEVLA